MATQMHRPKHLHTVHVQEVCLTLLLRIVHVCCHIANIKGTYKGEELSPHPPSKIQNVSKE